jgi:predicted dehydrogenase
MLGGAAALASISLVPRHVLGGAEQPAPSDRIALAGVGVGGVGFGQLQACEKAGFQIAVLCDVDDAYAKKAHNRWPKARRYRDFREMLQAEGDKIDAVYCGTPDHTHAVISVAALRRKKHVCCVKPLTRTVHECRAVVAAAREAKVATQVTASPNTSNAACRTCELIWAGAIGPVREVHVWSNRPLWPQGMDRPPGEDPVPATLDWDLWIGPAPMRPFKNVWPEGSLEIKQVAARASKGVYHPWNFRGWWDFGTGALGDMGCHHLNTPFRALKLKHPVSVSASSTRVLPETAPLGSIVTYEFPAREGMPPVRIVWYDGGLKPPYFAELEGRPMPAEGTLYVGDEGKMLESTVLPAARAKKFEGVPKTLPRRAGTWGEWFEACRGGEPAGCNFDWAGPLTEFVLLGNIAIRTGKFLAWNGPEGKFTNDAAANKFLQEQYRAGWTL